MSDEYIDLNDAPEASGLGSRMTVEPGEYTARFSVDEDGIGLSKNGYPQVAGRWTITEGEYTGQTLREWVIFSPKSAPFLKLRFRALGIPTPGRLTTRDLAGFFARKAHGRLARITVAMGAPRENGKQYPEVVNLAPITPSGTVPLWEADTDSLEEEEDAPF